VLRAKGLVYLYDDPGHAYILQLVGVRISLEKGPAWEGARPKTQIIVIGAGLDIDPAWLETSLLLAYL
jgi:G3E family GTPase